MASLGDIGSYFEGMGYIRPAVSPFTTSKQPTPVDIHITDAPDGAVIILSTRGAQAGDLARRRADSTGAKFYDLDDGDYLASVAFDGSPGLAWSINVTGTVVTITRISTSGIIANWSFA